MNDTQNNTPTPLPSSTLTEQEKTDLAALTAEEKIDRAAARILKEYHRAFEELAK